MRTFPTSKILLCARWHITASIITKRNTANKENLANKKVLRTYRKGFLPCKKDLLSYTQKDLLTSTKNPWQIATTNFLDKFLRQILAANSHSQFLWRNLTVNSYGNFSRQIPTKNS